MGNTSGTFSTSDSEKSRWRTGGVLLFLHRTWAVIVTERWSSRASRHRNGKEYGADTNSEYDSQYSQYSYCTCSQCRDDAGFSSWCTTDFFDSGSSMAPNSEESGRFGQYPFAEDSLDKQEKQRPPVYNPEDYALSLKKWGRKPSNGGTSLYSNQANSDTDSGRPRSSSFRDYSNPILSPGCEMTLRQFGTVSELLTKLKADLRLAYPSFVQEFVAEPLDGVTLLLELLRMIQLSQSNAQTNTSGSTNTTGKIPPSIQKRALLDELSCLHCLWSCCTRYSDSTRKLPASPAGLYTLAVCIMSNVNKARILALELLTKACEPPGTGHSAVSEALSTLRLRFGEPVRFRFLVGMLMSAGGQGELLAAGLKFLNSYLESADSAQKKLYIQAELEQAGFDVTVVKKNISINSPAADQIFEQLDRWEKNYIDVETLLIRIDNAEKENDGLRDKVLLLERRIQILQEEKGILMSLEQCLKERCSELQDEVTSLKSGKSPKRLHRDSSKMSGSTPAEDEGISSSERSLTPEGDNHRESPMYEMYSLQGTTLPISKATEKSNSKLNEDDEETTIDEVIEELRNIINDAETEQYMKEEKQRQQEKLKKDESKMCSSKVQIKLEEPIFDSELEIVPSNLHPQPPRRTRSLVHLYIPAEDYDYENKEIFFENETTFTSEEGSDSLLSASKCHLPRLEKRDSANDHKRCQKERKTSKDFSSKAFIKRAESFKHALPENNCNKSTKHSSFDGIFVVTDCSNSPLSPSYQMEKKTTIEELTAHRLKSKSLDRIDDGLDAMVDIVVTENPTNGRHDPRNTRSDSHHTRTLSRSISSVFVTNARKEFQITRINPNPEEKQRMFLPAKTFDSHDKLEAPYYFPRLQEKKNNSSFLVKRGHVNAGLYSGYIVRDDRSSDNIKKDFMINLNSKNSLAKVTDLPSGLY